MFFDKKCDTLIESVDGLVNRVFDDYVDGNDIYEDLEKIKELLKEYSCEYKVTEFPL